MYIQSVLYLYHTMLPNNSYINPNSHQQSVLHFTTDVQIQTGMLFKYHRNFKMPKASKEGLLVSS